MVFDSKELGVQRTKEFESQLADLGLELSKEKTSEPLPISDNEKLFNWLDEIRYDFVKSTKTHVPLTEVEKLELFTTLQRVAGDVKTDIKTITRYLGLYIRFTERLDDKQKLKTVYATAAYLLIEDRPKHNATCIAIQSLIKSCHDNDSEAWDEFAQVVDARTDEYFKIVLCQEVIRILEDGIVSENQVTLNKNILLFIQKVSIDETQPVAASVALNVLTILGDEQYYLQAHQILAFSENFFLRPRAINYLHNVGRINTTSLSRLSVATLLEVELFIKIINEPGTEIFKQLIEGTKINIVYQLALPHLIRKGLLNQDKGITEVWNILPTDSKTNIAYFIANKIIVDLPIETDKASKIEKIMQHVITENLSDLGTELYSFARYASLLPIDHVFFSKQEFEQFEKDSIEKLPTPEGITLLSPIFTNNYYVHYAQNERAEDFYYEHVDERELNKVGGNIASYSKAIQSLLSSNIILPLTLNKGLKNNLLIVLTPIEGTQSLATFIKDKSLLPKEVFGIIEKVTALIEFASKSLGNLSEFIPIPSLHTLYIDDKQNLSFGVISLTIGSEKKYIGKSGNYYKLQSDDISIEAMGLLYFEMTTKLCAVEEIVRSETIDKTNLDRFNEQYGIILVEIVKKASKPVISARYANLKFLVNDIYDWSRLETVLLRKDIVSTTDASILRIIWNLEIFVNRRVLSEFRNNATILLYAHQLQKAIIGNLIKNDVHKQEWIWNKWSVVSNSEKFRRHLASDQSIILGKAIEDKITSYHTDLKIEKTINFPLWLYASATHVELESLRRGLHKIVGESKNLVEFTSCKDFVLQNQSVNNELSIYTDKPNDRLVEATNLIKQHLSDIFNRLQMWLNLNHAPSANWIHDNLLILTIIISKRYGLTIVNSDGEAVSVKKDKKIFNSIDFLLLIQELLSVIKSDLANSGKEKPVLGIRYAITVQGKLSQNNMQILRSVHRYFDRLDNTIYMKFRLKDPVQLKIRSLKTPFVVNKEIIIEENHNHEDYSLTAGCPYSLDIYNFKKKQHIPLIASFPIVTGKSNTEQIYPIYHSKKFNLFTDFRLKYQRRYPIISAFLEVHSLLVPLFIFLFSASVQLNRSTDPVVAVVVNGILYALIFSPLAYYFKITYKMLITQNPNIRQSISVFLGT